MTNLKELKKVKEPTKSETVYQCPRCKQDFCRICTSTKKVDFEIEEESEGYYHQDKIQWKDLIVCPKCYNQLIDLAQRKKLGME